MDVRVSIFGESVDIFTHFYYHSPTKYQELVKNAHCNFWQITTLTILLVLAGYIKGIMEIYKVLIMHLYDGLY